VVEKIKVCRVDGLGMTRATDMKPLVVSRLSPRKLS
jgi:hypothetical protein